MSIATDLEKLITTKQTIISRLRDKGCVISDNIGFKHLGCYLSFFIDGQGGYNGHLSYESISDMIRSLDYVLDHNWSHIDPSHEETHGYPAISEAILEFNPIKVVKVTIDLSGYTSVIKGLTVIHLYDGIRLYVSAVGKDIYTFYVPINTPIDISFDTGGQEYRVITEDGEELTPGEDDISKYITEECDIFYTIVKV